MSEMWKREMWAYNNAGQPRQYYFQDAATPIQEAIIELHDHIGFYMILVLGFVLWFLIFIINNFITLPRVFSKYINSADKNRVTSISLKDINHGTFLEIVWTLTPALILILIAFPSFKLLYLIDEVLIPHVTIKFIGSQWYWSVEVNDFLGDYPINLDYDTYLVPTESLYAGDLRLLTVDNNIVVPKNTIVRYLTTATDVIHSLSIPSLGIKLDAIPGRLNQGSMEIQRSGLFFGNCAEICGNGHFAMPVVLEAVSLEQYVVWLISNN